MLEEILQKFALDPGYHTIEQFGTGLINNTYKVSGRDGDFILQKINTNVFRSPEKIVNNLAIIQAYLNKTNPGYLFVGTLPAKNGDFMVKSKNGSYYRLFPFISNSRTVNFISEPKQAYEAARQFGRFTSLLNDFDVSRLQYTLTDFHNLKLRFEQFKTASLNADQNRLGMAAAEVKEVYNHYDILQTYNRLVTANQIPLRVIHHDTKISNVLFDDQQNGLCVIDLDTVMPGYYLSDVGDMMRTYLSEANEEEEDLSKILVRESIFDAICKGYLSEMGKVLNDAEKDHFIFSGKMMIYMQGIRFLSDFLNGDIYYTIKHPEHNLIRARNQFKLLNEYTNAEEKLKLIFIHV